MATQSVAQNITTDGDTTTTPAIVEGQYLLGMSGDFDGATIELFITLGPANEVPIGISYTAPSSDIIWLPRCTAFVRTTGAGSNTDVDVAIGELSSQMHRFN
ncbi:MAG: hypothetical protein AAGA74_14955 [Pseudomonadota bacterium]